MRDNSKYITRQNPARLPMQIQSQKNDNFPITLTPGNRDRRTLKIFAGPNA
jgi:hypothetical protein